MGLFEELQAADEAIKLARDAGLDTAELEKVKQEINVRYQDEVRAAWWKAHLQRLMQ